MRNPYRLYRGQRLKDTLLNALIFPGIVIAHAYQINKEHKPDLKTKTKIYATAFLGEGLKLFAEALLVHNIYDLSQKYLLN